MTCLRGFGQSPTQYGLYSHIRWLHEGQGLFYLVATTKKLVSCAITISCAITAQLFRVVVLAYAKRGFSYLIDLHFFFKFTICITAV